MKTDNHVMARPDKASSARGRFHIGGAIVLLVVSVFMIFKYLGTINHWKMTHWLFSYELGFVKRGLVGSLTRWLLPGEIVTAETLVALSLVAAAVFMVTLTLLAAPSFANSAPPLAPWLATAALLSAGVGQLLADLGRFDILNYTLCLIAVLVARRVGRFPYPLFLGVAFAMLLTHEASLLLSVPVVFVAYLRINHHLGDLVDRRRWPALAARAAPVVIGFAVLTWFGGVNLGLRDLLSQLAERADFFPSPHSAYVLIRGLDSNITQVLGWDRTVDSGGGLRGLALGGIATLSFFTVLPVAVVQLAFAHACFRTLSANLRRPILAALYLCFLAPFPLLLVGVDWGRWAAMASANIAILMLLFASDLPAKAASPRPARLALFALVVVILSAGSGYPMSGARWGYADSPQSGVLRWIVDQRQHTDWYRAFIHDG